MPADDLRLPPQVEAELVEVVGDRHVLRSADVRASYERDWTGRFVGATPAVIRPGSTEEVAACVAICDRHGVAVVPQGGNTGLVAGGVPLAGEVVLSLRRLDRLDAVSELDAQVTVGAGVTLATLQRHARDAGFAYAVDLAARDTATVGGTIATNAGGLHVLRYGPTRDQLAGVEAVLASGAIVSHLGGLSKDNTGYDLAQLLCGSEGTLAVVTAARLRLVARPPHRLTALLGASSAGAAVEAVARWRRELPGLEAAEVVLADGIELVCSSFGWPAPLAQPWPVVLVIDVTGDHDPTERVASVVADTAGIGDVAVATDAGRRADLWRYREDQTAAISTVGVPHKFDVTLPLARLADFIDEVPAVIARVAPTAHTWLFGHLGDGNIHVNVTGLGEDDRVDDVVLTMVAEWGGSISAEHGIGRAKRPWLHLQRSAAELEAFRAIKDALDPRGILNPNVLLPPVER